MNKIKVLFVCVHNAARSQMAEAFLNQIGGDSFIAESAGFTPGTLNPLAIKAMDEIGIDISKKETRSVFDLFKEGKLYNYVITVCDQATAQKCPVFPGVVKRAYWSFEDPSQLQGTEEEKLKKIRKIRDQIKLEVQNFVNEMKQ